MRKACGVLCVVMLATACGGSGSTDAASADSCRELVDVGFNIANAMIGDMSGWSEERAEEALFGELPPELERFDSIWESYYERVEELDCDPDDMDRWQCEHLGRLKTGNAAGRMMRDNLEGYCSDIE